MSQWIRLWDDMPTDPKWRLVARRSKRSVHEVIAVFIFMLNTASDWSHRGHLENWNDEVVGAALDLDGDAVEAIRLAMQGLVLDGDKISGWEKRQPKREDSSTERVKAFRERKEAERKQSVTLESASETVCNAHETHGNAPEEKREDKIDNPSSVLPKTRAPDRPTDDEIFRKLNSAAVGNVAETAFIRPILDLIAMGCDFETHILPAVSASVPKLKTPLKSWGSGWLRDEIIARAKTIPKAKPPDPPPEMVAFLNGQKHPKWLVLKCIEAWNKGESWGIYGERPPYGHGCQLPPEYLEKCSRPEDFLAIGRRDVEEPA